jgi:hypothetical protein
MALYSGDTIDFILPGHGPMVQKAQIPGCLSTGFDISSFVQPGFWIDTNGIWVQKYQYGKIQF